MGDGAQWQIFCIDGEVAVPGFWQVAAITMDLKQKLQQKTTTNRVIEQGNFFQLIIIFQQHESWGQWFGISAFLVFPGSLSLSCSIGNDKKKKKEKDKKGKLLALEPSHE